jgi:hypothetical protein
MPVVLRRLWIQITADRKRFGLFGLLLAVGMLLWARIIVISNPPRTSVAVPGGNTTVDPTPPDGPDNRLSPPLKVQLARWPHRDPFIINPELFPKPTPVVDLDPDRGKLPIQPVENPQQVEARLRARLRALVDRFKLEAVMRKPPLAVISGKTYQLGDPIPAFQNEEIRFTLVEVGQRSVTLEYGGREFELKMALTRPPRR